jgi:hypothetical protein
MQLSKDLREFLESLNANEVECLVVGAYAVGWHGYPRYTGHIDILLCPTQENAERVLRTLVNFGFGSLRMEAADFTQPDQVIQLGRRPNRIDLVTSITGVSFADAWESRIAGDLDGCRLRLSEERR